MISRRNFLTLASGLLLPEPEPVRVYSFVGGWALPRWWPVLWDGLPVFQGPAPLAIWDRAPGEFLGRPDARFRIATHRELERFALLRREHHSVGGLCYRAELGATGRLYE